MTPLSGDIHGGELRAGGRAAVFEGPEPLKRAAAEAIVRAAQEAVESAGRFTVALSGGSTPKALYAMLAAEGEPYRARLPWPRIHFFFGDERHVPPDHADSNYRMAKEALLARAPVPPENVHRMLGEAKDAGAAAEHYEAELRAFFGTAPGEPPRFDLALLGLGPDAHTASLFPGTGVVNERARLVAAPWVAEKRTFRITLTVPVFNAARAALFLIAGGDKADAVRAVVTGTPADLERYPAQAIRPADGLLAFLLDRAAAERLER